MNKIPAVIIARGGSTRIPRKNLVSICGEPLVAWSIIQARGCSLITDVYVSTDDDEIAETALYYGANVIMRPVWDNGVTGGAVFKHAMDEIGAVNHIVTMLPTSPLKMPYDLTDMISLYLQSNALVMCGAAPLKETVVLKNTKPYEQRYGVDSNTPGEHSLPHVFEATYEIFDKYWNYSKLEGGWSISEYNWQMDIWNEQPRLDVEIDTDPNLCTSVGVRSYYPIEEWQCHDLDYPEDIALVELLLTNMILKGRSIYEAYGVRKPYVGNMNQLRYANAN